MNSNPNSCHYGFVTYKHEVSIEYALQLYKGTHLFSKELFVKKKGKSNRNGQSNDFKKHNALNSLKIYSKKGSDLRQLARNEMRNGLQNVRLNNNCDSQMIFNFKPNSVEENWSTRNKQYDRGPRKYSSRSHEQRRHKGRNSSNKLHHSRKTRY